MYEDAYLEEAYELQTMIEDDISAPDELRMEDADQDCIFAVDLYEAEVDPDHQDQDGEDIEQAAQDACHCDGQIWRNIPKSLRNKYREDAMAELQRDYEAERGEMLYASSYGLGL